MAKPRPQQFNAYAELSPLTPPAPLTINSMRTLNKRPEGWFGTGAASGYVQSLLTQFEESHPEAAKELACIANEAKWSSGWKDFGRLILEVLG